LNSQPKSKRTNKTHREIWFVYILRCADKSLYTGIAKNIQRRLAEHTHKKGSRILRGKLPLKLVHQEKFYSRSAALKREAAIKKLSRHEKLLLLA
jgi:predicted GIY-YIG superfamily endonuclease